MARYASRPNDADSGQHLRPVAWLLDVATLTETFGRYGVTFVSITAEKAVRRPPQPTGQTAAMGTWLSTVRSGHRRCDHVREVADRIPTTPQHHRENWQGL